MLLVEDKNADLQSLANKVDSLYALHARKSCVAVVEDFKSAVAVDKR